MSDGAKRTSARLNVRDGLLLGLGALGLAVYFWLLPVHHPDAAADHRLGEAGALEASARYLSSLGYATDGMETEVSFRRLPELLDTLQAALGRTAAVEALREGGIDRLPAYYWRVTWYRPPTLADDERQRVFTTSLGSGGGVWEFQHEFEAPSLDRAAVRAAEMPPESEAQLPAVLTDSLLTTILAYEPTDSVWQAGPKGGSPALNITDAVERVQRLNAARPRGLPTEALGRGGSGQSVLSVTDMSVTLQALQGGPDWAAALARHHLAGTFMASYEMDVDSTYLVRSSSGEREVAAVRFVAREPVLGRRPRTTLRVAATGALMGMETNFVPPSRPSFASMVVDGPPGPPPDDPPERADEEGFTLEAAGPVAEGAVYLVLVLLLLAIFFRRLGARLLDTRMALRDALWGGFFAAMMLSTLVGYEFVTEFDEPLLALLAAAFVGLVVGLAALLLVLFLSSAADSMGRDVWPEKLDALQLVREASLLNAPVGRAMLRGVSLAGSLLGLLALVLMVFPDVPVPIGDNASFLSGMVLSPIGYAFGASAFASLFLVLAVLVGLGSLLAQRWRPGVVLPLLVVVLALASAAPLELAGTLANWALGALVGGVLVAAFWRSGALTCFVCYFLLSMLWTLSPGWMIEGLPEAVDFGIALGGAGLVLALGFVGVVNGRETEELQQYVPAYITELAQKERMGRELEIAHQVQEFFLPRRMPDVGGVDVAAMCLAAQEVGGDYYDFIELGPGRLGVAVGDVSGKGIQAAFFMTLTKGFLQTLARSVDSPAEVLRRLNALFRDNAPRGLFVSMIYGVLDVEARTFTFARAGHNPLILTRTPSQEADFVQPAGLAIGLVSGHRFDDVIREETIHLRPGDTLVFYTDGFSEAMNAARVQYGDDRLARKVSDVSRRPAGEILRAVSEDVHHFVEAVGRHDDMTMVVLKLARRADPVMSLSRGRQVEVGQEQQTPVPVP